MRARLLLSSLVVSSLALAACSSGGGETPSPAGGSGSSAAAPASSLDTSAFAGTGTTAPTALTFSRARAKPGTGVVTTTKGGVVKAVGDDGTAFVLTVPPKAVLGGQVTITLTPLAQVSGVPGATSMAAVKMEPDGLQFLEPASLVITPKKAYPVKSQAMFIADGSGQHLMLGEMNPTAKAMTLTVHHFSTAAAADIPAGVKDAVSIKAYNDLKDVLSTEWAKILGGEREKQLLGTAETDSSWLDKGLKDALEQLQAAAEAALEANKGDCAALELLGRELLGIERQKQLLGTTAGKDVLGQVMDYADAAYPDCEAKAIKKCQEAESPDILMQFWLGQMRQRALLGRGGLPGNPEVSYERAQKTCAPPYTVEGTIPSAPSGISLSGTLCGLGAPFTLSVSGDFIGTLSGLPSSKKAGKAWFSGEVGNAPFPAGGNGTYDIALSGDKQSGTLTLDMDWVIQIPVVGSQKRHGTSPLTMTAGGTCPKPAWAAEVGL